MLPGPFLVVSKVRCQQSIPLCSSDFCSVPLFFSSPTAPLLPLSGFRWTTRVARRRRGGRGRGGATAAASAVGAAAFAAATAATPSPTSPTSTIAPQPTPRVLDSPLAGADPTASCRLTSSVSHAPLVRTTEDAELMQPPARLAALLRGSRDRSGLPLCQLPRSPNWTVGVVWIGFIVV